MNKADQEGYMKLQDWYQKGNLSRQTHHNLNSIIILFIILNVTMQKKC